MWLLSGETLQRDECLLSEAQGQKAQFAVHTRPVGKVICYVSHRYYPDRGLESLEEYACNDIEERVGPAISGCIEERELWGGQVILNSRKTQ